MLEGQMVDFGSQAWNSLTFCSQAVVPIGVLEAREQWTSTERLCGLFLFSEILWLMTGPRLLLWINIKNPESVLVKYKGFSSISSDAKAMKRME